MTVGDNFQVYMSSESLWAVYIVCGKDAHFEGIKNRTRAL